MILQINDLTLTLRGKKILNHVQWTIQSGQFWLMVGPNGAGKTTLLRALAGLVRKFDGEILLKGRSVSATPRRELARRLAYLPQFSAFTMPMTAGDVVSAGLYPYHSLLHPRPGRESAVSSALDRFGIADLENRDMRTLSGGERRKVMLASAVVQDVPVILMDEPFTFLDPEAAFQLKEHLTALHREGRTIVAVSHRMNLLFPVADHLAALRDGRMLSAGPLRFDPQLLHSVFGVDFHLVPHGNEEILHATP